MVARMPSSRAAHATACPWLPALAAMTPAAVCSGVKVVMQLTAPRILNDPVRWRFSAFRKQVRPVSRRSDSDVETGVRRTWRSIRSRAASMSASVGAVFVVNVEHLTEDLVHGADWVELPPPHLVEEPEQLRILGHCILEMPAGSCGGDREHLGCEVRRAPLCQPS